MTSIAIGSIRIPRGKNKIQSQKFRHNDTHTKIFVCYTVRLAKWRISPHSSGHLRRFFASLVPSLHYITWSALLENGNFHTKVFSFSYVQKSSLTGPFSSQLPSLKHSTTKLIDTGLKHAWCTCPSLDHVFITRSFRLGCPDRMWVEDQGGGGVKEYSRLLYSRLSRQSEYQGGPKETLTLSNSGFIHWGACYSS